MNASEMKMLPEVFANCVGGDLITFICERYKLAENNPESYPERQTLSEWTKEYIRYLESHL